MLRSAGSDLDDALLMPPKSNATSVMAITGKAGSGKTLLLAELYKALEAAGVEIVSGDYESRKKRDKRTLAILAPTNKAASVLRFRGVPATTIHRILYTSASPNGWQATANAPKSKASPNSPLPARLGSTRPTNPYPAHWRLQVCADLISSPAGNDEKSRWTSALSMNPRCWMTSNSKTLRKSSPTSCCLATRHSLPRSTNRARWCSKNYPRRACCTSTASTVRPKGTRSLLSPTRSPTRRLISMPSKRWWKRPPPKMIALCGVSGSRWI